MSIYVITNHSSPVRYSIINPKSPQLVMAKLQCEPITPPSEPIALLSLHIVFREGVGSLGYLSPHFVADSARVYLYHSWKYFWFATFRDSCWAEPGESWV